MLPWIALRVIALRKVIDLGCETLGNGRDHFRSTPQESSRTWLPEGFNIRMLYPYLPLGFEKMSTRSRGMSEGTKGA